MRFGPLIFLGVFLTFCSSWLALVYTPYLQLGFLQPESRPDQGGSYPQPLEGLAEVGQKVYAKNGCMYCHSQQIRPKGFGADIDRGWGTRRTVARDYLFDNPVMLGTMRTGPDLANIGYRQRGEGGRIWHHKHLYNPQITSPGSIMPSFSFLYETRKIAGQKSVDALDLPPDYAPPEGYEVVPKTEAKALVEYLLRLDRTYPLEEAKQ